MNITQKLVADVKRHNKIAWHDKAWHDFQELLEVRAINDIISSIYNNDNFDCSKSEIVRIAKERLEFNIEFNKQK